MALGFVVFLTIAVVCTALGATCALCLERRDVRRAATSLENRVLDVAPYLGITALFFLGKRATHGHSLRISRALDWDLTAEIYAIEGAFVGWLQDVTPEATLEFFSGMYMFGFPYLIVTAPILYFLSPSRRHLKELLVAYLLNYAVGTLCYTLFIVYGPRNHLPSVDGLMYTFYPQTQEMTAAVSANTNVFPSLHTSLAVVVALFAWRSRESYPRWAPIASFVTACVVFSTMYLGIHWVLDVVAGIALAAGSVVAAERLVARAEGAAGTPPTPDENEEGVASDASD